MGRAEQMLLVGGHPALDFVNTLGGRPDRPDDEYLLTYRDLLTWGERTGVLAPATAARLGAAAAADPRRAARALGSAREFRSAVDAVLRARLTAAAPSRSDLDIVRHGYREALGPARLDLGADGMRWTFEPDAGEPDLAWWPVTIHAVKLLEDLPRLRLRTCEHCRWLFLDASRNHTRRWCSMNSCGARSKMRRYRSQLG